MNILIPCRRANGIIYYSFYNYYNYYKHYNYDIYFIEQ